LTFFSPSGYEVKKDSPLADLVAYLPMDTLANSREFLDLVRPELALFIKYEIWPNYLRELQKRKIPTLLVSARFSKGQIFFRPFGGFMRKSLGAFTHFFVQDRESMELLKGLGHGNVTLGGDSRFDRVVKIAGSDNRLNFMDAFKGRSFTLVAGSSWPEDERILIPYINGCDERIKFILAPHEIKEEHIAKIDQALTKSSIRYSQREGRALGDAQVLILDTIGLLNKVYSYADVAYVGGGFATGLHNTLEPAVHGIPVIIGPRYQGFREAVDLVRLGGLLPVGDQGEFTSVLDRLREGPAHRERLGRINQNYINAHTGATRRILDYIG